MTCNNEIVIEGEGFVSEALTIGETQGLDIEMPETFGVEAVDMEGDGSAVALIVPDIVPEEDEISAVVKLEMEFGGMGIGLVYVGPDLPNLDVTWNTDAWFHSDAWFRSEAW